MTNNETSTQGRFVNENLNKLIFCLKKYANGDFSEKITITEEVGEFSELAADLNSMVEKVHRIMDEKQKAINELDDYKDELNQYKNHLEYKVSLRTEKLEKELIERRKREERLLEKERRFKEAEKLAAMGHWYIDLNQNKLYFSDGIYQIFEIEPSQFDGSFDTFIDFVHPDDRSLFYNSYIDSVENGKTVGLDHRILLKDGRIKYVHEEWKTYYDSRGNVFRSLGTVQDITERRQLENKI